MAITTPPFAPFTAPNELGSRFAASVQGVTPQVLVNTFSSISNQATTTMLGMAQYFTPINSTRVKWTCSGQAVPAATTAWNVYPSYGTGTAPTAGAATAVTQVTYGAGGTAPTGPGVAPFNFVVIISGLVPGTAYWFDLEEVFSVSTMGALTKVTSVIEEI